MTATKKRKVLEQSFKKLKELMFSHDRMKSIVNCRCSSCGCKVESFRDSQSRNEYFISGWCQQCQDVIIQPMLQAMHESIEQSKTPGERVTNG